MKSKLMGLILLLTAVSAFAYNWGPVEFSSQLPQDLVQNPVLLTPQTDDPQPDTLKYCNPAGGWILNGPTNIWGATRFTPADEFELRAAYIQVVNPQSVGSRCYVHVMNAVTGGGPTGTPLASGQFQSPPSNSWIYVQFPSPVTFQGNQEFFIVYGPTPSGPYPSGGGYWPSMDDAPTGNRNYYATGTGQTPPASWFVCSYGDFMIMAGGEYTNEFTDLEGTNVFHSTKKYWVAPGNDIILKATAKNVGMTNVASYLGHWEAYNAQNVSVFSADGVFGPLNQTISQSIVSPTVWTAPAVGMYTVKFYLDAPEDENSSNDTTWMEIYITDLNDMPYTYVHEAVGGNTSTTEWGITYNNPEYPTHNAHIDSFKVLMNETVAQATFHVYANDAFTGQPGASLWQTTMAVDSGWVTLRPELDLFENYFTVAYAGDGAMSASQSGVNSANNDSMMTSAWTNNGGWEKMYSGDWPFTVYLSVSSAIPPEPVIVLNDSSIAFGDVLVGEYGYFDLIVYNMGGQDDLILTAIQFNSPAGIFGINGFTPMYHIAAGDSAVFELWFHPAAEQTYNYQMGIVNNATAPAPMFVPVSGTGTILGVGGNNSGEVNSFSLAQNNPNPFNPTTNITYTIPADAYVTLSVYNVMGEEIVNLVDDYKSAGKHTLVFDASGLSSGVYFYKINAGDYTEMKKMVLMK